MVTQKSWLSEFGARSDENKRVGDLTTACCKWWANALCRTALHCYDAFWTDMLRMADIGTVQIPAMMDEQMDTVEINGRSDFALWAIQRAQEIVMAEGSALALAARDMDEDGLKEHGAALGKAIADAMLEVFDGLMTE